MNSSHKTILFAGGGTGGPVTPLLAVAEKLKNEHSDLNFLFVGTTHGPEKDLVGKSGFEFMSIPAAKLRRYFSWRNFVDVFVLPVSVACSLYLIYKHKVSVIVSAGGYVAVPVIWAGWLLRKKVLIHQQDVEASLSNILTKPFANTITVTFPEQRIKFSGAHITGNPVRKFILEGDRQKGFQEFKLQEGKPVVFIYGGGSGSLRINQLIESALPQLVENDIQVLHQTGKNIDKSADFLAHISAGYARREFLYSEAAEAYAIADVVVSRAGMANISELSYLGKPAVVIPMPDSHQEKNAALLWHKNAAIVLSQKELSAQKLLEEILNLINDTEKQKILSQNISQIMPHDAASTIAKLVYNLL